MERRDALEDRELPCPAIREVSTLASSRISRGIDPWVPTFREGSTLASSRASRGIDPCVPTFREGSSLASGKVSCPTRSRSPTHGASAKSRLTAPSVARLSEILETRGTACETYVRSKLEVCQKRGRSPSTSRPSSGQPKNLALLKRARAQLARRHRAQRRQVDAEKKSETSTASSVSCERSRWARLAPRTTSGGCMPLGSFEPSRTLQY